MKLRDQEFHRTSSISSQQIVEEERELESENFALPAFACEEEFAPKTPFYSSPGASTYLNVFVGGGGSGGGRMVLRDFS